MLANEQYDDVNLDVNSIRNFSSQSKKQIKKILKKLKSEKYNDAFQHLTGEGAGSDVLSVDSCDDLFACVHSVKEAIGDLLGEDLSDADYEISFQDLLSARQRNNERS